MNLLPWAGFALSVPFYLLAFLTFQRNATILIFLLLLIQGILCLSANRWAAFLMLCAALYVFSNPTGDNLVVSGALGLAGILTGIGVLGSMPQTSSGKSRSSLAPLLLLMIGCATAFPAAFSSERLDITIFQVLRLAVVFGVLPVLCARWISPREVRLYIFIIAAGIVIYYAVSVFVLSGRLWISSDKLESVQGQLQVGVRSVELGRTHTGPALAIGCCVLWGLFLTERRLVYKAATLAIWAFGTSAVMYTGARGSMATEAFVCFCIACLAFWHTRRLRVPIMIGLLCWGMFIVAQRFLPDILSVVELRILRMPESIRGYDRIDRWLWSLQFFLSNPMGVGWTIAPLDREEQAHNDMLIMAMSFGVAGLAAYIVAFGAELRFLLRNIMAPGSKAIEICLPSLACLAALAACGFMDMVLVIGSVFDVSWLMVLLARASRPDDRKVL